MTPLERKFREGGGSNRKNHPWGGGMDIFWNHTLAENKTNCGQGNLRATMCSSL